MNNVLQLSKQPKVLNTAFFVRLAEANRIVRQLRDMGCRTLRVAVGNRLRETEIVIDRNAHGVNFPGVHIIVERRR